MKNLKKFVPFNNKLILAQILLIGAWGSPDFLHKSVKSAAQLNGAAYAAVPEKTTPSSSAGSNTEANEQKKLDQLGSQLTKLKTELGQIQSDLDRERDRTGKISNVLKGDLAAGCWAKAKIEKFEILISGEHMPIDAEINRADGDKAIGDEGNPRQFILSFGDEFNYTHSDEEAQSIFIGSGGKITSTEYAGKRIRDFEQIKIVKGGVSWSSVTKSRSCGFLGTGTCSYFENREQNRYRMDTLTIKVNDQILYRKTGINKTFKRGSLDWSDTNISANPEYQALMGKTDCQQAQ